MKKDFADLLTKEGICKKRSKKVCDMKNVGIICGKTTRRRKRGVEEEVDEVGFHFDISAFKVANHPTDCKDICAFLNIPKSRCSHLCLKTYKRFLKAAVMYSKYKLGQIYQNKRTARFHSAQRNFEPADNGLKTSDLIVECDPGMKKDSDFCGEYKVFFTAIEHFPYK